MRVRVPRRAAPGLSLSPNSRPGSASAPEFRDGHAIQPLLLCGLLLVAVNMRPALAEVGPVLGLIGVSTHLSAAGLSLLTALPVICFGLLAPLAPRLAAGWGLERSLATALAVLAVGMVLRIGPGLPALLGGTVLLGSGIALTNVLLPAMVKRDFSGRAGLVTGLYTTTLNLAATLAAASAVPLADAMGGRWRGSFAVWIVPVFIALVVWVPIAHRAARPIPTAEPAGVRGIAMAKSRQARQIITFTAAQSVIYYSVLAWLPSIFESHGLSATSAGFLLSVTTLVSAPVALVLPPLAVRRDDQRGYIALIAACALAGLLGVLITPSFSPYLWAVLLGIGLGGAFPLALTLFVLRTRDPAETARLSTSAQAVAYLVAAGGPVALGVLHVLTGSWAPGIGLLLGCAAAELLSGLGAGRAGYISTVPAPPADAADEMPTAPGRAGRAICRGTACESSPASADGSTPTLRPRTVPVL